MSSHLWQLHDFPPLHLFRLPIVRYIPVAISPNAAMIMIIVNICCTIMQISTCKITLPCRRVKYQVMAFFLGVFNH